MANSLANQLIDFKYSESDVRYIQVENEKLGERFATILSLHHDKAYDEIGCNPSNQENVTEAI